MRTELNGPTECATREEPLGWAPSPLPSLLPLPDRGPRQDVSGILKVASLRLCPINGRRQLIPADGRRCAERQSDYVR
jgi:hypothetical protein